MAERLTRWEGRDEDGPRAVLVRRDNFNAAMQEVLRKLAKYEDAEEAAENDGLHDYALREVAGRGSSADGGVRPGVNWNHYDSS